MQPLRISLIAISMLSTLSYSPAQADTKADVGKIDSQYDECIRNADGTDPSERACDAKALTAANKVLNKIYNNEIEGLKHPSKENSEQSAEILRRLISSERAWITSRDADCSYASTAELGGTLEMDHYDHCIYKKTKERILWIERGGE